MTAQLPDPTPLLFWGFSILSLVMAAVLVAALRRCTDQRTAMTGAGLAAGWMLLTGSLAASGVLDVWVPPRIAGVLLGALVVLVWAMRAPWAQALGALPLRLLVGIQGFRVLVELLLHEAVAQGLASPTLTWTGTNFDIVPGVTALLLAPVADRLGARWLQVWNLASAGVLVVTVVTALLAAPTPLQLIQSDPPNVWIATFPFVWLPAVLVPFAWLGHIVLYRRLARAG
ncbi:MAG: hypothetical protein KTR31_08110 [Myxococcales bacterium]|nr:hypothetical protein [Myxococcales bacterium]